MLFSSGLIAGGALMGIGVAALILGASKSQLLANALEAVRQDGIRVEAPADARVRIDGRELHSGDTIKVRSRWFETQVKQPDGTVVPKRELEPAVESDGKWVAFDSARVEIEAGSERDVRTLEFDKDERARTVKLGTVDTWEAPIAVESLGPGVGEGTLTHWLVQGDLPDVAFGQPLAHVMIQKDGVNTTVEIKAPQKGRLVRRDVAEGGRVLVHGALGALELAEPPIGSDKPPQAVPRRRIVVEPRPGSDAFAMTFFLGLCAVLVVSALPKRRA
jgi:hypothetical protein